MMIRSARGISSITLVLIAAVALMWVLSLCAVIVPSYNEISRARQMATLRMDLESSLNWAVDQLSSNTPDIDDKVADGIASDYAVPQNVVTDGSKVTISINNVPPAKDSGMYVDSLDSSIRANNIAENGWRVVIARGVRGGLHKSMRAVLMPAYGRGNGPTTAIFDYALFATGDVTFEDSVEVSVIGDPTPNSTVMASNSTLTIAKGNHVQGSVRVASMPKGDLSKKVLNIEKGVVIDGVAQANGAIDVASSAKVLNQSNDPAGAIQQGLSMDPRVTPPVPSAPSTATNLGAVKVAAGETLTLRSGDYVVTKFEMGNGAEVAVLPDSGPVNIYIKNANNGAVLNVGKDSRINTGGSSGDLRIWYPGNAQMNIGMGTVFKGVIAAPSSRMQVDMNSTIQGALIGNKIRIKKGSKLIFDAALSSATSADMTYTLGPKPIDHREAVSWQELDEEETP